jgi:hypothetical protein
MQDPVEVSVDARVLPLAAALAAGAAGFMGRHLGALANQGI